AAEAGRGRELAEVRRALGRDRDRRAVRQRAARDQRAIVRGALDAPREDDVLADDRRAAVVDRAVAVVVVRVGALVAALSDAGQAARARLRDLHVLPGLDRLADAVPEIAHRGRRRRAAPGLAQLEHPLVDVVAARRRRRERIVPPAAELYEEVHAGERGAARVDPRAVDVLLDEELRHEVAGLRTEDRDRLPGLGVRR